MPILDPVKRKAYNRAWMAARRAAFFLGRSCVLCGATERLELDHIDPKCKTTNAIWSWSQERREAELTKCQVLCRSCHRLKTNRENSLRYSKPIQHGTARGYKNRGCRCSECWAACKAWRKQRKLVRGQMAKAPPSDGGDSVGSSPTAPTSHSGPDGKVRPCKGR